MKALLMEDCRNCPYVKIEIEAHADTERLVSCNHPVVEDHKPHERRLHRIWTPLNVCPLPDWQEQNEEQ